MNPIKQAILSAYYAASLPSRHRAAVDRAARQTEPVRVLFYHRVADQYPNAWTMPTAAFARQIHWLRHRFDLVSLNEAQARIAAGRNRWPTACITFDDGYADNLQFALPLLLRLQIPFTYFVSTNHVLRGEPFPHDVEAGRSLSPNTLGQLRELIAVGAEVGAHTKNHVHLSPPTSREQLLDEIVGSKRELEVALEREVRYFAFPFGQISDLSPAAFRLAYEAGYLGACSAYGDYNFPGDDPFHLRRIHADPELIRLKNWLTIDPRKLGRPNKFDAGDFRGMSATDDVRHEAGIALSASTAN
ncbi:MAG TPA: polysaccharide deacetylase family protein [Lacipirellulaceae bacterium]|jgi:peptidoglycan/xylan/chitin deacetylase (PgdA/CDA1 family)